MLRMQTCKVSLPKLEAPSGPWCSAGLAQPPHVPHSGESGAALLSGEKGAGEHMESQKDRKKRGHHGASWNWMENEANT